MTAELSRQATGAATELTAAAGDEGVDAAVAAARRVIGSLLHAGHDSAADMTVVAERLRAVADHLDEHAPATRQRMIEMWAGEGATRHDPITGPENAIAPPLRLVGKDDGSVAGVTTLGIAYQGPPGFVHGGVSAMLLDHTLGVANGWAGLSGMTGELAVRYHRPTPLFEPLLIAGRQISSDGRKIRAVGSITAGGTICVSVEGLFVAKHPPRPR